MNKHLIWATTLTLIVLLICSTIIYINYNSWTIRFEMDNNTKEAIESIDYKSIANNQKSINLWISPSKNWTMITCVKNELFVNGKKQELIEEPYNEFGIWQRTYSDEQIDYLYNNGNGDVLRSESEVTK